MSINDVARDLSTQIARIQSGKPKPVRIAINGVEGSGKTRFAIQLVDYLNQHGFTAIHVTIDGYHFPKSRRYQQGRDSARGYYEDAYDERAFVDNVLLRSQANQASYIPMIHDIETDEYVEKVEVPIPSNTIIVVDGAYLFKPTYLPHWDLKIYLRVPYEVAQARGVERDTQLLGGEDIARQKYISRYHAAAQIYDTEVKPKQQADVIIDNSNFINPTII